MDVSTSGPSVPPVGRELPPAPPQKGKKVGKQSNLKAKIFGGPAPGRVSLELQPQSDRCWTLAVARPLQQVTRRQTERVFSMRILRSQCLPPGGSSKCRLGGFAKGGLGAHGPADGTGRFQRKEPLPLGRWRPSGVADRPAFVSAGRQMGSFVLGARAWLRGPPSTGPALTDGHSRPTSAGEGRLCAPIWQVRRRW